MRLAISIVVAFLHLAMVWRTAMAQPGGSAVAILELELSGDAAPELRNQIVTSIADGFRESGAEVIALDKVRAVLEKEPDLAGCTSTTCLARIGEMVGAGRFVRGSVQATGAAYTVTLELLTASEDAPVVGKVTEACTVCTMTELSRRVAEAAEKLASGEGASGTVEITSQPAGATLTIDGQAVGAAPFSGELPAGEHAVNASLPGYQPTTAMIQVQPGQTEPARLAMTLVPEPPSDTGGEFDYGRWKWIAAGGAAAMVVTGVVLIAMDGDGTCDRDPPQQQCPELRDTKAAGIVTIAAGLGLGGLSGWMFYKDRQSERSAAAAIAPRQGGAMATVTIRF